MTVEDLLLPDHAHVPGKNARHREGFLDHVIGLAPSETNDEAVRGNAAWLYGLRLLEQGYFWEAHEVFEALWMRALPNSREKHLTQALIHITNAALKIKMGRVEAAGRLKDLAEGALKEAFTGEACNQLMGLDWSKLIRAADTCATKDFRFDAA